MVSIKCNKSQKDILKLREKLVEVKKNKNAYILDNSMDKAYSYLKKESKIESKLNELELFNKNSIGIVDIRDIAMVINRKTNIPIYEILKDNIENINMLEKQLKDTIVDQDNAINSLLDTTKKFRLGYSNHKVKSFLFVGPTGVGKTELAKIYAYNLMGKNNLIRLNMSEYADATAINKIIGSAPGYVGYKDNNTVLDKIKMNPTAVILLDEIDKASQNVINLLYQILDEGIIKDASNNIVNLNNNIIIMTSNLGFEEGKLGFSKNESSSINNSLMKCFSKALINRIDHVVIFNNISREGINVLIKKKLNKLIEKYPGFSYEESLVSDIIEESNYKEYGARRIGKIIDNKVEGLIIARMLKEKDLNLSTLKEEISI